jgi:hypothetical protein
MIVQSRHHRLRAMLSLTKIINGLLRPFNRKLVPAHHDLLIYQHDYGLGGYDKYRTVQIAHNKRKIHSVWADEKTIDFISTYIKAHIPNPVAGLCHGSRNGFEVIEFSRRLNCNVCGTDISDTAKDFPNTYQWDFHEPYGEWIGKFSFVYTNSLDQALDPRKALHTWADQLRADGFIFIEHTMQHSPQGASSMDPFGAHPLVMPYLIFEWGRGKYRLVDILKPDHVKKGNLKIWIFVIGKWGAQERGNRVQDDRLA